MAEQVSARGTYLKVVEALRSQIDADTTMMLLPSYTEIMQDFGVSRGVVVRVVAVLSAERRIEPSPGARWRIVRDGHQTDSRPLAERVASVIWDDHLEVGASFPSATALCERFQVSRPTLRRALDKLEAQGILSEGGQGKLRTVRALPRRDGDSGS